MFGYQKIHFDEYSKIWNMCATIQKYANKFTIESTHNETSTLLINIVLIIVVEYAIAYIIRALIIILCQMI